MKCNEPRIDTYRSLWGAPRLMLRTRQRIPDLRRRPCNVKTCTDTPPCGGGKGPTNRSFSMLLCAGSCPIASAVLHKDTRWLASSVREQIAC